MKKKFGIGIALSSLFLSCTSPLPPPKEVIVEVVSVYDFSLEKQYEEMDIYYEWSGIPSFKEVILKNSLYSDITIFLDSSLTLENGYAKASHKHLRFSYFMDYLPHGLYSLIFKSRDGSSFIYDFYLDDSFLREEGRNLREIIKEGFLEGASFFREEELESCYRVKNKGKILSIKGLSLNELGPPGLEPGTNGL